MATSDEVRRDIEQVRGDLGSTLEEIGERVAPKKVKARAKAEVADKVEDVRDKVSPARAVRRRGQRVRQGLRVAKESVVGGGDGAASEDAGLEGPTPATSAGRNPARARPPLDTESEVPTPAGSDAGRVPARLRETGSDVASRARAAPEAALGRAQGNPLAAGLVAFGAGFAVAQLLAPSEPERKAVGLAKERIEPLKQRAVETGRAVAGELQPVAQAGVERVKDRAATAAQQLKEQAQGAAQDVKGQAQSSAQEVTGQAKGATRQVKDEAKGATKAVKEQAKGATRRVKAQAQGAVKADKGPAKSTTRRVRASAPEPTKAAKASSRPSRARSAGPAKSAARPTRAGSGAGGPTNSG
ncbi:MAG: DUF3618 domain-containing protein [Actinomycetota bacterium]|nr:DUF3618 domain-containing protein [Actinomycetota bacterium]